MIVAITIENYVTTVTVKTAMIVTLGTTRPAMLPNVKAAMRDDRVSWYWPGLCYSLDLLFARIRP